MSPGTPHDVPTVASVELRIVYHAPALGLNTATSERWSLSKSPSGRGIGGIANATVKPDLPKKLIVPRFGSGWAVGEHMAAEFPSNRRSKPGTVLVPVLKNS